MKPPKADWMAWIFQFIAGSAVGLLLGFVVIHRGRHRFGYGVCGYWLGSNDVMPFLIGAAFLGGALASYYGDRLWMEDRVIPNDSVPQSYNSLACSVTLGCVGVGLMICAILRTVGWLGR